MPSADVVTGEPRTAREGDDTTAPDHDAVERLNRGCSCITVNQPALRCALEADLAAAGLPAPLVDSHPHLFAGSPVFLSRRHVARMAEIIGAVEAVVRTEGYREAIAQWTPASRDPGASGVFFGYDFHLGPDGPRLIEINTNAGGALLNAYLARAQRACCPQVEELLTGTAGSRDIEAVFVDMFREEWRRGGAARDLRRIAIVDDAPAEQALYPEFVLFQRLFERAGIAAVVADARDCALRDGALWVGGAPVDLVYNRVCDFYLDAPEHAALRGAFASGAAVVTPHPRAYALHADKRSLTLLSDAERLGDFGVDAAVIETLATGIPATVRVTPQGADALWARRRSLFFKPATGYGSRGAYRGAKLTQRVWRSILAGDYIAQELVRPSERELVLDDGTRVLKVDLRCYVYAGEVQVLAARLYHGQTTNLRTPGGGFAPIFTEAA